MTSRDTYMAGPASGAEVRKDGDNWTLILVRELRHPPDKVWKALLPFWEKFTCHTNKGD